VNQADLHSPLYEYLPNPHVFTDFAKERKPTKYYTPPKDTPPSFKSACSTAIYEILRAAGEPLRREQLVLCMDPKLRARVSEISNSLTNLVALGRLYKKGRGKNALYSYKPITEVPKL